MLDGGFIPFPGDLLQNNSKDVHGRVGLEGGSLKQNDCEVSDGQLADHREAATRLLAELLPSPA